MKPSGDPPRLTDPRSDVPDILRDAITVARTDRAHPDQLGRVAARLTAVVGAPVMPPASPSPPWWTLPSAKLGGALLIAAGIGGALLLDDAPSTGSAVPVRVGASTTAEIASALPNVEQPSATDATEQDRPAQSFTAPSVDLAAPPRSSARVNAPHPSVVQPSTPAADPAAAETEIGLLQRAQAALDRDPRVALSLATKHEAEFPAGQMTEEREVVAVGALVRLGRRDEARQRADRFRARFPKSAYLHRLDVLLGR